MMNQPQCAPVYTIAGSPVTIASQMPDCMPGAIAVAFGNWKRLEDPDASEAENVHMALGHVTLARYLGHGEPKNSHRSQAQLRSAMRTLRKSGRYDQIVDDAVCAHAPAVPPAPGSERSVKKPKAPTRRLARTLDERTAHLFPNDHQFNAFSEAITTPAACKVIPVEKQMEVAKAIMAPMLRTGSTKKEIDASYIRSMVQHHVSGL